MGVPNPERSAGQIRDIFDRMDWNDRETVALIGGGHAFGKAHGACPNGAGPNPEEQPLNPWPGLCGTGKGNDTYTSGIEGQWTTNPFRWDNEYYQQLLSDTYLLKIGPGDKRQWENQRNGYMMMTTDLALVNDDNYKAIVQEFATDLDALNTAFAAAWKKLVEAGGRRAENWKCIETYKGRKFNQSKENEY